MDGRGRKRKINEVSGQEPTGQNFTKYSVFVSELREHVVTYLNSATLFNYSQCSEYCNAEAQKLNIKMPALLYMKEQNDGISVKYSYDDREPVYIDQMFKFSQVEGTTKKVEDCLLKLYRNAKVGKTRHFSIDLQKWPIIFGKHKYLKELSCLSVTIRNTMLDDFIEFARTCTIYVMDLRLCDSNDQTTWIEKEKTKEIFDTEWFQQQGRVEIALDCDVDNEDFLNFKNRCISLDLKNRRISDDTIRQKLAHINRSADTYHINIKIPARIDDKFDLLEVFPNNHVQIGLMNFQYCEVGNYLVEVDTWGRKMSIHRTRF